MSPSGHSVPRIVAQDKDGTNVVSRSINLTTHLKAAASCFALLKATLFGKAFLGKYKATGQTGLCSYYLFTCAPCKGLHVDYAKGFNGYLECPIASVRRRSASH